VSPGVDGGTIAMMANPIPPGREAAATVVARARPAAPSAAAIVAPAAPIDRARASLPGGLPVQALLAWGGVIGIAGVVALAIAVRSPKDIDALDEPAAAGSAPVALGASFGSGAPSAAPSASPPKGAASGASSAQIDAARAGGADALAALAQRYPEDPAVLSELFVASARDKRRHAAALKLLRRLLEVSPAAGGKEAVQQALKEIASGPPETSAEAFEILRTRMGSYGPDVLLDLVQGGGNLSVPTSMGAKERALAAMRDPAVQRLASKATLIAWELSQLQLCARKGLLARARDEGDARSLPSLKPMAATGCKAGFPLFRQTECNPCLAAADRAAVSAAIEAIERRSAGKL
jgi:hypothetical protein